MPEVRLGDVKLGYRQLGAGPDVVLVHGLATSQAFWNLALVARLAESYRVTTYDLRGHGYSGMPPTGYAPAQMACDLAGLCDALAIERAHLVGHSFGGQVVAELALAQPQRARSLVLADTRLRSLQPRQPLHTTAAGADVRAVFARYGDLVADDEPEVGVRLLEILASGRWEKVRGRLAERTAFVPLAGRGGGRRAARRWLKLLYETTALDDFRHFTDGTEAHLPALACPLLAVYGARSPNLPTCEALARTLPHVETAIVADGGHFHPATQAEHFFARLEEFMQRAGAARAR